MFFPAANQIIKLHLLFYFKVHVSLYFETCQADPDTSHISYLLGLSIFTKKNVFLTNFLIFKIINWCAHNV